MDDDEEHAPKVAGTQALSTQRKVSQHRPAGHSTGMRPQSAGWLHVFAGVDAADERQTVDVTQALLMQFTTEQQPSGWPSMPRAQSGMGPQSMTLLHARAELDAAELGTFADDALLSEDVTRSH